MAKQQKPIKKIEPKVVIKGITLNEYLSLHNRKRKLDGVIKKWYFQKDKLNSKREKTAWDKIIQKFFNETEK